MPTDYEISIDSSGNPDPSTLDCDPGDKITWKNDYSKEITTFSLPSAVSPQTSPAPIAVGATTRKYTVNNGASGTYTYEYGWPDVKKATRSGTIDVGSR